MSCPELRSSVRRLIMTAADLSDRAAKPFSITKMVAKNLYRETFVDNNEYCEKVKVLPTVQLQFLNEVCLPTYELLVSLLPGAQDLLDKCRYINCVFGHKQDGFF